MRTQVNTENVVIGFEAGYNMLPSLYQTPVRKEIMAKCGFSYDSFYNRLTGKSKIMKLEIPVIERAFAKYHIDPWTGESTK